MFIVPPQSQTPQPAQAPSGRLWLGIGVLVLVVLVGGIVALRSRSAGDGQEVDVRVKPSAATVTGTNKTGEKKAEVLAPAVFPSDMDNDGVSDEDEKKFGTDPAKADTDGDGVSDGEEVYSRKTDPLRPDNRLQHPSALAAPTP